MSHGWQTPRSRNENWIHGRKTPGLRSFTHRRLRFLEPATTQLLLRHARQVRLDIENRRAVQHVDAAHEQCGTLAPQQRDDREAKWIRPSRRARREHAVRTGI